jgi:hypothetical protein
LKVIAFQRSVEYAIRKVQGKQMGLKLNGTRQLLVTADYGLEGNRENEVRV